MREIDTETVVWPEWCYSGEGRAEVRDQGQQKGCAPNGLNHSTVNSSPSPPSNLSNQNLNLSLFASTINSMSANKLLTQLAHQNQLKSSAHHQQLAANSAKRKLAEKMLLNERLSPSSGDSSKPASCDNSLNNNNNFNVNNLNLERLSGGRGGVNGHDDYSIKRKEQQLSPSAIKSERISPVNFAYSLNGAKMNGSSSQHNHQSRSRSSTPSNNNSSSTASNHNSNPTRELSPLSRSQQQQQQSGHQQLSNQSHHLQSLHHPSFSQQQHRDQQQQQRHQQQSTELIHGLIAENLQQSMIRQPEHQARNYSDFMRSLAAKYNNSSENNSNLISPNGLSQRFGNLAAQASPSNNSTSNNPKVSKEKVEGDHLHPIKVNSSLSSSANSKSQLSSGSNASSGASSNAGSSKSETLSPPNPANSSLISSFLSGLPFSSTSVFPPLIDMTSTQALVTLARAAKEAEFQGMMKSPSGSGQKRRLNNFCSSLTSHLKTPPNHLSRSSPLSVLNQNTFSQFPSFFGANPKPNPSLSPTATAIIANNQENNLQSITATTTSASAAPLDLSSGQISERPVKRIKLESNPISGLESSTSPALLAEIGAASNHQPQQAPKQEKTTATAIPMSCGHQMEIDEIRSWNVDQVCDFVSSIDICAEYAQNFRDQSIDGMGLPMLTEEHLRNLLSMKLGPALKLKAILATKMGTTCASCEKYRNSLSPAPSIKTIAEATPATISNASSRTPTPSSGIVESGGFNIPTPTLSRPQSNSTTEIAQT